MGILAVLFGVGVGAFRRLTRPERVALATIAETLRSAALTAASEGAPASVSVTPETGGLQASVLLAVGNWHFEDDAGTGWPMAAVHEPGLLAPGPVLGSFLALGPGQTLSLPSPPASFDSPHGFGVELHLRPVASGAAMTILERPGIWSLRLDEGLALVVTLFLLPDAASSAVGASAAEELRVEIPGLVLSPQRLQRLNLSFDGTRLTTALDGLRVGQDLVLPAPRQLVMNPGVALGTGRPPGSFLGDLDELRVASVVARPPSFLPPEIRLLGAPRRIGLDGRGRLDPAFHRTPVVLAIEHGDPPRQSAVEISLLGTVATHDAYPAGDAP